MISARIRKSLTYLHPSKTSFLREFHGSLSLSLQFRRISRKCEGPPVGIPTFSELLVGKTTKTSKSILLFLKENSFSETQLEKMMKSKKQLLSADLEKSIKPKFEIFQAWGFSGSDIVEMIAKEPTILCCSTSKRVIPSLIVLKDLLGSLENVVKAVRKCGWFFTADMQKVMFPNVEFLKSSGLPTEHVLYLLNRYPRCLFLRPDLVREHVKKVNTLGMNPSSKMYIYAFRIVCSTGNELWELKVQTFRDLGFSETDILTIFRKAPQVFGMSVKKINTMVQLVFATKIYTVSSIVANPTSLCCSVDNRMMPRLQVLESLNKRNLVKKWPGLGLVYTYSDERFYQIYVAPYLNEVGIVHQSVSTSVSSNARKRKLFEACIKNNESRIVQNYFSCWLWAFLINTVLTFIVLFLVN